MSNNPEQDLFDFVVGLGKGIVGKVILSEFQSDLDEEHHNPDHKDESLAMQVGHAIGKTFISIVNPFHSHHDQ